MAALNIVVETWQMPPPRTSSSCVGPDDAGSQLVAAGRGARADLLVEVVLLARGEHDVGGVFGGDLHVRLAVAAARVRGGVAGQQVADAHVLGLLRW